MKIKNWIEWDYKMTKIYEKIQTPIYCKKNYLPLTCESQSRLENQTEREISSHCDKNSTHNVWNKYR